MILIVGGVGQGKLDYVLNRTGLGPDAVARDPETAMQKPVFSGLAGWVREHPDTQLEKLLAQNPDVIIVCDEVGCGVVPMALEERAWREAVGRLCCRLAERAQRVERIFCGLSTVLKGENQWNSY